MIRESDVLFKEFQLEDLKKLDGYDFSHLSEEGCSISGLSYMSIAYKNAAKLIYEKIKDSRGNYYVIDSLVYPMCFCYRHSVELYLKALAFKLFTDETKRKDILKKGHNLMEVWLAIKPELSRIGEEYQRFPCEIGALDSYIIQIDRFDGESMKMRYPIEKDLTPNKKRTWLDSHNVNTYLLSFLDTLEEIEGELDCIINMAIPTQNIIDEFIEQVEKNKDVIDGLIETARSESLDKDKVSVHNSLFERALMPSPTRTYLQSLNHQQRTIVEVLYYAGGEVKRVNWPKAPKERKDLFVAYCCDHMRRHNLSLTSPIDDETQFNIFSKSESVIFSYLSEAVKLLF